MQYCCIAGIYHGHPPDSWPPAIVLLLSFRSFCFCCLISEVAWPIVTKLYHMFSGDPELWNLIRSLGSHFHQKFRAQKRAISAQFRTSSRHDREYLWYATTHHNWKTALQTTDTPAQANLILCTLVHKQLKTTGVLTHTPAIVQRAAINNSVAFARWQQQAAIKLGHATHSS